MTTKELRKIIFQELSDLNNGESTKEKASAVASLSKSLIRSKELEILVAKFRIETGTVESEVNL